MMQVTLESLFDEGTRNGLYKTKEFQGSGCSVVKMSELYGNRIIKPTHHSFEKFELSDAELTKYKLLENDLLFSRTSVVPEGVGLCSIVKDINTELVFESNIIRVRLNAEVCDPKFIFYYFQSHTARQKVISISNGAAIRTIRSTDLSRIEIALPLLQIQQKIAFILSAYNDLIENNLKRIALLEKSARLLYEEWFVRLRFPGYEHTPIVNGVPEGWEKTFVPDIIDINPKTVVPKDGENWHVDMAALATDSMAINNPVLKEGNSGSKFQNGDTLFARITPCLENGKTGYVNFLEEGKTAFGSTEFIVLRGKRVPSEFVYCLSRTYDFRENAIKNMVGSSGRQRVKTSCFDEFPVPLPPTTLLNLFEENVAPAFKQIKVLSTQNQKLKQARDILLPKLINGEIPV